MLRAALRGEVLAAAALVLLSWTACATAEGQDPAGKPGSAQADATGWMRIPGGPGTGCALGTPYGFYLRPGSSSEVMVYFEGGGACWNDRTCDPRGDPTYDPSADESDHPARADGLFDFNRAGNPVRNFTILFVPYCTGDVHLGTRDVEYSTTSPQESGPKRFTVRHRGARNVDSALRLLQERYPDPQKIFVSGTSAGAIPSPLYAARLAQAYPKATVVQLADGAGGYRAESVPDVLKQWGAHATIRAAFPGAAIDVDTQDFEDLYTLAGRQAPSIRYAQFNHVGDEVQLFFLGLLGVTDTPLAPLLGANLEDMRRSVSWFRAYTAPGEAHGILGSPGFYTLAIEGVRIRDWVAGLIEGRDINDVGQDLLAPDHAAGKIGVGVDSQ